MNLMSKKKSTKTTPKKRRAKKEPATKKRPTPKKKRRPKTPAEESEKKKVAARDKAHSEEKDHLIKLLDELRRSIKMPPPEDQKFRLPILEVVFCLVLKVYLQVSHRTLLSFLGEMRAQGYITIRPHFNSLSNYMNAGGVTLLLERILERTGLAIVWKGIHAAIDSTRLYTPGYHEEEIRTGPRKGQREVVRNYVKLHVIIDISTHFILAAKVSGWWEDEKPFFEPLLRKACSRFPILSIAGDKNYAWEDAMKLAKELGVIAYLVPKKNYKTSPEKSEAWNESIERYREGTEEDEERFDQRKQIETVFSMCKVRFRDELESVNLEAQVNEALCLAVCHNLRILIFLRKCDGTEIRFPQDEEGEPAQA
jgi:hypothetical protein